MHYNRGMIHDHTTDSLVKRTPVFVALVGASGAGKTALAQALLLRSDQYKTMRTCTTRHPEVRQVTLSTGRVECRMEDDLDYQFVDDTTFDELRKAGELVATTTIHGSQYGVPAKEIDAMEYNSIGVVVVDSPGAVELAERYAGCVVAVVERDGRGRSAALSERFGRNHLDAGVEKERLTRSQDVMLDAPSRCYKVHNGDGRNGFETALDQLDDIARSHWESVRLNGNHEERAQTRDATHISRDVASGFIMEQEAVGHGVGR